MGHLLGETGLAPIDLPMAMKPSQGVEGAAVPEAAGHISHQISHHSQRSWHHLEPDLSGNRHGYRFEDNREATRGTAHLADAYANDQRLGVDQG